MRPLFIKELNICTSLLIDSFKGGSPGARGLNLLIRADGRTINLGPKTAVPVEAGVSHLASQIPWRDAT